MTTTASGQLERIDPATGASVGRTTLHSPDEVDHAVGAAFEAQRSWGERPAAERAEMMAQLAIHLRANQQRYAELVTSEMGKPITEAVAEIEKCAWACDYYAENGPRFLADEEIASSASRSIVAYQPIGVILAIMPWNYPFWQAIRFASAAITAGNAAVLKHASIVSGSALALEAAFAEAGFPPNLLRTILVSGEQVLPLLADPRIRAATVTGSSETGARVAAAAGAAVKKCVLELGGADPFIVLADADVDAAVAAATRARNQNTGQSCIAAKRFLVEEGVADEFESKFAAAVAALRVGDPRDPDTQIGPLARADLVAALESQVDESVRRGARILTGGKRLPRSGFYFEPTVLVDCSDSMPVMAQETFGPVAAVQRVRSPEEAVAVGNSSEYGLGGSIWSRDRVQAETLARRMESGAVFVNGITASDPRLPFGGVKGSGYGRELSIQGIREFTNIQTIWIGD